MKTPYLYEYFSIAEGDLIAPERSLYAGNLAGNRQVGAMFLGELFEQPARLRRRHLQRPAAVVRRLQQRQGPLPLPQLPAVPQVGVAAGPQLPQPRRLVNGGDEKQLDPAERLPTANDQTTSATAVQQPLADLPALQQQRHRAGPAAAVGRRTSPSSTRA